MDGTSLNISEEKLNALKQILPEAFSEGKIDWEKLKATLGENINFTNERYVLNWAGKSDAFKTLQTPTTKTLVPAKDESINFDETENIFIEGENLEVLKVLQKSYFGKVKMIYIDPPYNTGNDSFIYPDKFSETKADYEKRVGDKDEDGYMTKDTLKFPSIGGVTQAGWSKNSKENGQYHSNWLNMMMPRLYLAKNLLRQDGVIYMQIDDNELHNSILLFNEIFGEENYVSTICVKMSHLSGMKMSHKDKKIPKIKEFILVYAKNRDLIKLNTVYTEGEWDTVFDRYTKYVEIIDGVDSENWEVYNLNDYIKAKKITNEKEILSFKISNANKIFRTAVNDSLKDVPKEEVFRMIITKTGLEKFIYNGEEVLFADKKLVKIGGKNVPAETIGDIWTDIGINNLHKEGEVPFENGKKPLKLVKRVLDISSLGNDIILDFFAGSGTTAHAVMDLNKEDGGNRKYICVQLPELTDEKTEAYKAGYKTIAEISKERIRRAGKKINGETKIEIEELQKQISKLQGELPTEDTKAEIENLKTKIDQLKNQDLGFKVLKLEDSNFKQWQQFPSSGGVSEGRGGKEDQVEALKKQMKLFVDPVSESATIENMVYELLLKSGKDLNSKIFPSFGGAGVVKYPSFGGVAESRGGLNTTQPESQTGLEERSGRNAKNYFNLPYNPKLKQRARELRQAGNLSEVLFWNEVKNKQFKSYDFDRQKIIGNYIVDFYCSNCNVVIEIDGSSHDNKVEYDAERDTYLESLDLTVIHIPVADVMNNMSGVMEMLNDHPALRAPLQRRGIDDDNLSPNYYTINDGELVLLLEKATQEIIDSVIAEKPIKVIALDKLFKGNDQLKTNTVLQMKDAGIEFKTI